MSSKENYVAEKAKENIRRLEEALNDHSSSTNLSRTLEVSEQVNRSLANLVASERNAVMERALDKRSRGLTLEAGED